MYFWESTMFKKRLLTRDFIFTFLFPLDFVQQDVVNASVIQINTYTDVDGFFLFLPYLWIYQVPILCPWLECSTYSLVSKVHVMVTGFLQLVTLIWLMNNQWQILNSRIIIFRIYSASIAVVLMHSKQNKQL